MRFVQPPTVWDQLTTISAMEGRLEQSVPVQRDHELDATSMEQFGNGVVRRGELGGSRTIERLERTLEDQGRRGPALDHRICVPQHSLIISHKGLCDPAIDPKAPSERFHCFWICVEGVPHVRGEMTGKWISGRD